MPQKPSFAQYLQSRGVPKETGVNIGAAPPPSNMDNLRMALQELVQSSTPGSRGDVRPLAAWLYSPFSKTVAAAKENLLDRLFPKSDETSTFLTAPSVTDPHPLTTRTQNELGHLRRSIGDTARLIARFVPDTNLDVVTLGAGKVLGAIAPFIGPLSKEEQALAEALNPIFGSRTKADLIAAAERVARQKIRTADLTRTVEELPSTVGAAGEIPHWRAAETPSETASRLFERKYKSIGGGTVAEVTSKPWKPPSELDIVQTDEGPRLKGYYVEALPSGYPYKPQLTATERAAAAKKLPPSIPSGENVNKNIVAVIGPIPKEYAPGFTSMAESGTQFRLSPEATTLSKALPQDARVAYSAGKKSILPRRLSGESGSEFTLMKFPGVDVQKQPGFQQALQLAETFSPSSSPSQRYEEAAQLMQVFGVDMKSPARSVVGANLSPWISDMAKQAGIKVVDLATPEAQPFLDYLAKVKKK
jgi:hypothetical protein